MRTPDGNVIVVATGQDDLSTFVTAVEAAGLTATLEGAGPFTIFAPSTAAFEAYFGEMGMTVEDAAADPEVLAHLLPNHVVPPPTTP